MEDAWRFSAGVPIIVFSSNFITSKLNKPLYIKSKIKVINKHVIKCCIYVYRGSYIVSPAARAAHVTQNNDMKTL